MRLQAVLLSSLLCCIGAISVVPAAVPPMPLKPIPVSPPAHQSSPDPRFVQTMLREGTALQVLLQTALSTEGNQPGDPVEGIMTQNLYLGNRLLLSKNTRLQGVVARLEPPLQGRDAILGIRFTDILLDNGEKLPISAHVRTEHPEHIWGGMTTRGTKPMLSTQRVAGIGEYNRIVYGGPRTMGSHVQFLPGEHWTIILEQPLSLVFPQDTEN